MAIDPEYELTTTERAHLAVLRGNAPGFAVLIKIFESEIEKFKVALINAKLPEDVIIQHNLAKAAAMFYTGVINRINAELEYYSHNIKVNDKPGPDITEGILWEEEK